MDYAIQVLTALDTITRYGLPITFFISSLAFITGLLIGVILVFLHSFGGSIAEALIGSLVTILRAIPPVLMLFIVFYGFPFLGISVDRYTAAILGLGFISSAYQSQILRSSVEAVTARQFEAALSIGLSRWEAYISVIIPQALRLSIPGLVNEFTIVLKDSSLAYAIGVVEVFTKADQIARARFDYLAPMTAAAILYFVICFTLSRFASYMYRKLRELGYGV
jgi:polar amino acid transport system permease protein